LLQCFRHLAQTQGRSRERERRRRRKREEAREREEGRSINIYVVYINMATKTTHFASMLSALVEGWGGGVGGGEEGGWALAI
jgi:hypothetical protein